jgi:ESCRT-II complex subunit VPS22
MNFMFLGFWTELLGMGNFYYEIAVQSVEIVLATTHLHGGVMTLGELQRRLNTSRGRNASAKNIKVSW